MGIVAFFKFAPTFPLSKMIRDYGQESQGGIENNCASGIFGDRT